jgi:hypothetical protein
MITPTQLKDAADRRTVREQIELGGKPISDQGRGINCDRENAGSSEIIVITHNENGS